VLFRSADAAAQEAAKELANLKAQQASSAKSNALADYIAKIKGKVRGNIVLPGDIKGNPEAVFEVTQLPSGEVLNVKLKKSSGNSAWDNATERAILKSSPLPKPAQSELFSRVLELKFRPLEE
jgi:colicin import membrane protein